MINIPSVDISDFLSENTKRKQKFVDEIGFALVNNHFLSEDLMISYQENLSNSDCLKLVY